MFKYFHFFNMTFLVWPAIPILFLFYNQSECSGQYQHSQGLTKFENQLEKTTLKAWPILNKQMSFVDCIELSGSCGQ